MSNIDTVNNLSAEDSVTSADITVDAPSDEASSLDKLSEDLLELRFLTKENCTFKPTKGGFLSLEHNEKTYDRVGVYRTFPFTHPKEYISIREADDKAREIGMVKSLEDISKEQRELLKEQLRIRYFTPIINKIIDIKDEYGYAYFDVQTDYGVCRFTTSMGSGSTVHLSDTRILITDLDGNRFEIPDINKLSSTELKKLDLFI